MKHIHPLQPLEFRAIKLNHDAVATLLRKILVKISMEQFRTFGESPCIDFISFGQYFDEKSNELVLFAYRQDEDMREEDIIPWVQDLGIVAEDSLFVNDRVWQHCNCIQLPWERFGHLEEKAILIPIKPVTLPDFWSWSKQEVRVIRITQRAINELLWENFMDVGYQLMELPQEDSDDLPTIYRMSTEDRLQSLTLYVMNLLEASDSSFRKIDKYCDLHIRAIDATALDDWTEKSYYTVGSLANLSV